MGKGYIFVLLMLSVLSLQAADKVIYGQDNRQDIGEASSFHAQLAQSTAAQIKSYKLTKQGGQYSFSRKSLQDTGVCSHERFSGQQVLASCSAFLIASDVIVTAGHCVKTQSSCQENKWVFGFTNRSGSSFSEQNVYSCKKLLAQAQSSDKNDYAVIKLDRPVLGKRPLEIRKEGRISSGAELVVIGHPSGLPVKIADGANVRENSNSVFFLANLDTYGGNSGSAVLDAGTGIVEGILVRGETDYEVQGSCKVSKKCSNSGCRGEDVTRINFNSEVIQYASSSGHHNPNPPHNPGYNRPRPPRHPDYNRPRPPRRPDYGYPDYPRRPRHDRRQCQVELQTARGRILDRFIENNCRIAYSECQYELRYRHSMGRNPRARCVQVSRGQRPGRPDRPRRFSHGHSGSSCRVAMFDESGDIIRSFMDAGCPRALERCNASRKPQIALGYRGLYCQVN